MAPELQALAKELSLDVSGPDALPTSADDLERFHVIVGLAPDVRRHLEALPYSTAFLRWEAPRLADAASGADVPEKLRELSRELSNRIHDLMTTLRGDEAS